MGEGEQSGLEMAVCFVDLFFFFWEHQADDFYTNCPVTSVAGISQYM